MALIPSSTFPCNPSAPEAKSIPILDISTFKSPLDENFKASKPLLTNSAVFCKLPSISTPATVKEPVNFAISPNSVAKLYHVVISNKPLS